MTDNTAMTNSTLQDSERVRAGSEVFGAEPPAGFRQLAQTERQFRQTNETMHVQSIN